MPGYEATGEHVKHRAQNRRRTTGTVITAAQHQSDTDSVTTSTMQQTKEEYRSQGRRRDLRARGFRASGEGVGSVEGAVPPPQKIFGFLLLK